MMERNELKTAVGKVAVAYLFLHLHFTINDLDLLPNWAGYCLILSALPVLSKESPSAALLRPLGWLLAAVEAVAWIMKFFGAPMNSTILLVLFTAVDLYFHFQLLTELSAMAAAHSCPRDARRILHLRTVRTVLLTVFALPLPWQEVRWMVFLMAAAQLVTAFWLCGALFVFRRSLDFAS